MSAIEHVHEEVLKVLSLLNSASEDKHAQKLKSSLELGIDAAYLDIMIERKQKEIADIKKKKGLLGRLRKSKELVVHEQELKEFRTERSKISARPELVSLVKRIILDKVNNIHLVDLNPKAGEISHPNAGVNPVFAAENLENAKNYASKQKQDATSAIIEKIINVAKKGTTEDNTTDGSTTDDDTTYDNTNDDGENSTKLLNLFAEICFGIYSVTSAGEPMSYLRHDVRSSDGVVRGVVYMVSKVGEPYFLFKNAKTGKESKLTEENKWRTDGESNGVFNVRENIITGELQIEFAADPNKFYDLSHYEWILKPEQFIRYITYIDDNGNECTIVKEIANKNWQEILYRDDQQTLRREYQPSGSTVYSIQRKEDSKPLQILFIVDPPFSIAVTGDSGKTIELLPIDASKLEDRNDTNSLAWKIIYLSEGNLPAGLKLRTFDNVQTGIKTILGKDSDAQVSASKGTVAKLQQQLSSKSEVTLMIDNKSVKLETALKESELALVTNLIKALQNKVQFTLQQQEHGYVPVLGRQKGNKSQYTPTNNLDDIFNILCDVIISKLPDPPPDKSKTDEQKTKNKETREWFTQILPKNPKDKDLLIDLMIKNASSTTSTEREKLRWFASEGYVAKEIIIQDANRIIRRYTPKTGEPYYTAQKRDGTGPESRLTADNLREVVENGENHTIILHLDTGKREISFKDQPDKSYDFYAHPNQKNTWYYYDDNQVGHTLTQKDSGTWVDDVVSGGENSLQKVYPIHGPAYYTLTQHTFEKGDVEYKIHHILALGLDPKETMLTIAVTKYNRKSEETPGIEIIQIPKTDLAAQKILGIISKNETNPIPVVGEYRIGANIKKLNIANIKNAKQVKLAVDFLENLYSLKKEHEISGKPNAQNPFLRNPVFQLVETPPGGSKYVAQFLVDGETGFENLNEPTQDMAVILRALFNSLGTIIDKGANVKGLDAKKDKDQKRIEDIKEAFLKWVDNVLFMRDPKNSEQRIEELQELLQKIFPNINDENVDVNTRGARSLYLLLNALLENKNAPLPQTSQSTPNLSNKRPSLAQFKRSQSMYDMIKSMRSLRGPSYFLTSFHNTFKSMRSNLQTKDTEPTDTSTNKEKGRPRKGSDV